MYDMHLRLITGCYSGGLMRELTFNWGMKPVSLRGHRLFTR